MKNEKKIESKHLLIKQGKRPGVARVLWAYAFQFLNFKFHLSHLVLLGSTHL